MARAGHASGRRDECEPNSGCGCEWRRAGWRDGKRGVGSPTTLSSSRSGCGRNEGEGSYEDNEPCRIPPGRPGAADEQPTAVWHSTKRLATGGYSRRDERGVR